MGIFNTLFHKNNKNVQQAVNQAQPNGMYESNKLPSSCRHLEGNNISIQDVMPALTKKSSHSRSLSASTSTTASSGHSLKSLSRRSSTEKVPRFQVLSNGKHIHRLTQPPPQSKLTTSVNGFVNGVAKKTMKWTEKKHTVEDTTREHQMLLKRLDCDTDNHATFLENYGECQETVGKGTCGVVRLVRRMEDGTERVYAVKELARRPHEKSDNFINRISLEFGIARALDHPNIIQTFEILPMHQTSPIFCEIMEYPGAGDLFNLLVESPLEADEANCFFKQLMNGIAYLHELGVAHRDLKPENLLVTADGCLKLSDFGSAICFRGKTITDDGSIGQNDGIDHEASGLVGSKPYIAPEMYTDKTYDAKAVDVWSCGVIYMALRKAAHLWCAAVPEDDAYKKYLRLRRVLNQELKNARKGWNDVHSVKRAKYNIRKKIKDDRLDTLDGIDVHAQRVMYQMLDPNPKTRITAVKVLETDWLDNVRCCRKYDDDSDDDY